MSKAKQLTNLIEGKYIPKVGDTVRFTKEFIGQSNPSIRKERSKAVGKVRKIETGYTVDTVTVEWNDGTKTLVRTERIEPVKQLNLFKESMTSMTYGQLPDFKAFDKQFQKVMKGDDYEYTLKGSDASTANKVKIPTSGYFDSKELYGIIKKLISAWEKGNDDAGDLASSFMYTLDFEWI